MIAFGPVPSRRLGKSLGINNIPPKTCSYSCIYCQVGRTTEQTILRRPFYEPGVIVDEVVKWVRAVQLHNEAIDYLTFVPDGEPTLDVNLGSELEMLVELNIPLAVISNASLIWQKEVSTDLCKADWVSLKVDTVDEKVWRNIDRPSKELELEKVLQGIREFADEFKGVLVTETMLVWGINDDPEGLERLARFLKEIKPKKSYISVPTRPPAEDWVLPSVDSALNIAYQKFVHIGLGAELLLGYEGDEFASTGDVGRDLLSITAVHPMKESAVKALLKKNHSDWNAVEKLLKEGHLKTVIYRKDTFYIRKIRTELSSENRKGTIE